MMRMMTICNNQRDDGGDDSSGEAARWARKFARPTRKTAPSDQNNSLTWHKYLPESPCDAELAHCQVEPHYHDSIPLMISRIIGGRRANWSENINPQQRETIDGKREKLANNQAGLLNLSSPVSGVQPISAQKKAHSLNEAIELQSARNLKHKRRRQHHNSWLPLLLLVAVAGLTCLHNAPSCSGFDYPVLHHHLDSDSSYYPLQQQHPRQHFVQRTYLTADSDWQRSPRSYNDEPLTGTMSTASGSFSRDPASTIAPPGADQSSWTSILNPILGLGQRPKQPQGGGGGGGGDEFDNHIKKILVPRVSGTSGNVQVRQYLVDEFKKRDYHVELNEFTGLTPVGKVKFANIIASSNPNACRNLVLACHYDSKMMDGFLGATDSAVPCAMLLMLAGKFSNSFRPTGDPIQMDDLGLKFILFDGEEAFVQWTQTDSLYGSRHLAGQWANQRAPSHCGGARSELERIELFVLLDLIGASDSSFVSYGSPQRHHYEALQKYEKLHLEQAGHNQLQARRAAAFKSRTMPLDFVEDDHVPFRKRGVPILLLLAHPFPKVWHTLEDNYEAIDFPKTRRILHVLEEFVANYPANRSAT